MFFSRFLFSVHSTWEAIFYTKMSALPATVKAEESSYIHFLKIYDFSVINVF